MKLKYFPASNVAPPSSPYHTLILESWDPYLEVSQMFLPPEGHRKLCYDYRAVLFTYS